MDEKSKIVGEVRRYDPYSRQGEVMLYDIDVFGFTWGYLNEDWTVMSKIDLLNDKKLRNELQRVEYDVWKRHNIIELKEKWENNDCKKLEFEEFCEKLYKNMKDK